MIGRGEALGDMGLEPKASPLPIIRRTTTLATDLIVRHRGLARASFRIGWACSL
jgi:hypothetical protein